jgi:hypothetical protein
LGKALSAIAIALLFSSSAALAQMPTIEKSGKAGDPAYVAWRCSDFSLAIKSAYLRQRAELKGAQPEVWKHPHEWAWDKVLRTRIQDAINQYPHRNGKDFVVEYLTAFRTVQSPVPFSTLPLYQSDKATCLSQFGGSS